MPPPTRKIFASGPNSPATYSFQGTNSSHSKDSGAGGRTYHMPNYATSYANEKSNLITIHLEENKGAKRAMLLVVLILIFITMPILHLSSNGAQKVIYHFANPPLIHQMTSTPEPTQETATSLQTRPTNANGSLNPPEEDVTGDQKNWTAYWGEPKPAEQCSSHGVRDYSARLWNLPFFSNWKDICERMPIEIHNQKFNHPDRCENKWPLGGIIGHWGVKDEGQCSPRWGMYRQGRSTGPDTSAGSKKVR